VKCWGRSPEGPAEPGSPNRRKPPSTDWPTERETEDVVNRSDALLGELKNLGAGNMREAAIIVLVVCSLAQL
jgi:hypothetical protein